MKIEKKIDKILKDKEALELQEQQQLLFNTDALLPKKSIDFESETFQLRNGFESSVKEVKELVGDLARTLDPMFPNTKPFFKLIYKLNGWDNLDPTNFVKPPVVALYIKQYIYGRFPKKEILSNLLLKDNPVVNGYIKRYKLYQFLSDEGLDMLQGYIKDAIEVMESSKDFEDFELKYTAKYKLSVQLKLFPSAKIKSRSS